MIYRQVSRNCKEGFFIMLERKYEFMTKMNCRGNEEKKNSYSPNYYMPTVQTLQKYWRGLFYTRAVQILSM